MKICSPFEEVCCFIVQLQLAVLLLPAVAEDEHDPGVELCEGGGHVPATYHMVRWGDEGGATYPSPAS